MGSPIANMLLGQAAPAVPNKPISEMTNEELAAYRRSLGISDAQAAAPPPMPAPTPAPTPAPDPGVMGAIAGMLSRFLPGAKDLAPAQAAPAVDSPEVAAQKLAERNRRLAGQQ